MFEIIVNALFYLVAGALMGISSLTGLTYYEVNIIVYYFLIPLSWCGMIDFMIKKPICSPIWTAICLVVFFMNMGDFST